MLTLTGDDMSSFWEMFLGIALWMAISYVFVYVVAAFISMIMLRNHPWMLIYTAAMFGLLFKRFFEMNRMWSYPSISPLASSFLNRGIDLNQTFPSHVLGRSFWPVVFMWVSTYLLSDVFMEPEINPFHFFLYFYLHLLCCS